MTKFKPHQYIRKFYGDNVNKDQASAGHRRSRQPATWCFAAPVPTWSSKSIRCPGSKYSLLSNDTWSCYFWIGLALLIEVGGQPYGIRGLGIAGAIAINSCGAGILLLWLLFAPLSLPWRGYIVLWTIVLIVLIIGIVELLIKP